MQPIINDKEIREMMAYHLRRALEDELVRGSLPPQLAKIIDESPDEVVEQLVKVFTQAATIRLNPDGTSITEERTVVLSPEDVQVVMMALSSIQTSYRRNVDVDLDGALLFCNRGRKMLKKERYVDAKRHFERAIQIKDNVKTAWEGLAEAQDHLGEAENAKESRRRAAQC